MERKNESYRYHGAKRSLSQTFLRFLDVGATADFTKEVALCDVGAGAGFPSIPLKIVFPQLSVTIVDSLNKRITFLTHLVQELGLENVHLYHDRGETFGQNKQFRETLTT